MLGLSFRHAKIFGPDSTQFVTEDINHIDQLKLSILPNNLIEYNGE